MGDGLINVALVGLGIPVFSINLLTFKHRASKNPALKNPKLKATRKASSLEVQGASFCL